MSKSYREAKHGVPRQMNPRKVYRRPNPGKRVEHKDFMDEEDDDFYPSDGRRIPTETEE